MLRTGCLLLLCLLGSGVAGTQLMPAVAVGASSSFSAYRPGHARAQTVATGAAGHFPLVSTSANRASSLDSRTELISALASVAAASSDRRNPVTVDVTGKKGVQPLSKQEMQSRVGELTAVAKQRRATVSNLTSEFTQQYGSDSKKWPKQARDRRDDAERTYLLAVLNVRDAAWFGKNKQKDIDDSVKDLTKQLRKQKLVRLVENRDAAELVVEVRGRAVETAAWVFPVSLKGGCSFLGLIVTLGPALSLSAERAGALTWYTGSDYTIAVYKRGMNPPLWEAEATSSPFSFPFPSTKVVWSVSYRVAAEGAAVAIETFVDKNYETLTSDRRRAANAFDP